ncbi:MAG TPA: lactate utilization protein [Pseudothermotoga sp.]|nr:lactate utilization protein [Pseudothermotoga sp.]HOK83839.1 lactate utilization protein [Pseudothermotoga sp.]HPP70258.1 lactate utilization protein [Pseudothermotoga sp.]
MREELYKFKYRSLCEKIKPVLEKKAFEVHVVENAQQAKELVEKLIPQGSVVSSGGSLTLSDSGILDLLRSGKYKFLDRYNSPDRRKTELEAFDCDYYLCSANAVTMNGELVFMDGFGNRVAAITYGPKNVVLIVSANKIVENLEAARERIRYITPMNAKRLSLSTPCATTGICQDCDSPQRICRHFHVVYDSRNLPKRIKVILVLEELGL